MSLSILSCSNATSHATSTVIATSTSPSSIHAVALPATCCLRSSSRSRYSNTLRVRRSATMSRDALWGGRMTLWWCSCPRKCPLWITSACPHSQTCNSPPTSTPPTSPNSPSHHHLSHTTSSPFQPGYSTPSPPSLSSRQNECIRKLSHNAYSQMNCTSISFSL